MSEINKCRNCKHHHLMLSLKIMDTCWMHNLACGCYLFIPEDNLLYLEYKSKVKERA